MIERTTTKTVTFTHPFTLSGVDEVQPAGSYILEIDEELIETLSFPAYRSTGTWIRLPSQGRGGTSSQAVKLTPAELGEALAKDALVSPIKAAALPADWSPANRARLQHGRNRASTVDALNQGLCRLTARFTRIWRR
jgi:hypothetical protein